MRRTTILGTVVLLFAGGVAPARAGDPIFDQARLHEVRIVMDPNDWVSLTRDFRLDSHYAANISIDGEVVLQVGIRSRGAGSRSGLKPGLKLDFNYYAKNQEFHDYKSLVLDNGVQDSSLLRERLAFAAFEAMGIPAPQIAHARLSVNDEYWGVYTIVEPVSKPFLKARLGEEGGTLFDYEYSFEYYFTVRGDEKAAYIPSPFEPQTNENKLDDGLVEFIRAANTTPPESYVATMGRYLDLDQFLTYVAVENALAESDGFLGYAGMNNFYLYQYSGQKRFVFIPWDKDTSFQSPEWPLLQRVETNELTRRLLSDETMRQKYFDLVQKAVDGVVNRTFLGPMLEQAYTQIREAVLTDKHKPYSNEEFELSVHGLRGIIELRRGDVAAQTK